jgi:hypothetical protein
MTNFSIGITTFERRLESLTRMIKYLKRCDPDIIINLAINGEVETPFSEEYRKGILRLCLEYKNIFPVFHQEFRALAKLWNTLVINSVTEYNLILNDDLLFDEGKNFIEILSGVISSNPDQECFAINNSFSHFVITKKLLDDMNYFDERFLLHGEEDGDFVWRYIDKFGNYPPGLNLPIIVNVHQTGQKDPTTVTNNSEIGYAEKPKFNQEFTVTKYTFDPSATISGLYGRPHRRVLSDERQYPYESFFLKNRYNFKNFKEFIL